MKKSLLFCQFSTQYLNKNTLKDISSQYYSGIYKYRKNQGYVKPSHFWELPLWIAEACGTLQRYNKRLYVITDISQAIQYIKLLKPKYALFSVLDVNKQDVLKIITSCKNQNFIIGGYIDFTEFKKLSNVAVLNSIKALSIYLKDNYQYKTDYALFKAYNVIPRLTLSNGCLNRCKFCTVQKKIIEKTKREVIQQAESFKNLNFKLVYINDKTFLQAKNYHLLSVAYDIIKSFNPDFKGFIVQTTASVCSNINNVKILKTLHVYAIELGIETFNNYILKELRKPQTEKIIVQAIENLKKYNLNIIGNFIIGFIQETKQSYHKTLNFINKYIDDFFLLNIYNLAIYNNTELSKDIKKNDINDSNELTLNKSFYNKEQIKNNKYFYNQIFKIGLKILKKWGGIT